ncbi:MAG TPA: cytochrome c maturation protein CcmE [Actinomycetota bacterium]|nr:cytochrome c maturation protein CcmE [Actinomycetota bacterium]
MPVIDDTDAAGFPELHPPEGFELRRSRVPLILLGLVVFGALFAVGFTMFTRSVVYYHTPTEVLDMPGEQVRISGDVVDGSIRADAATGTVSFSVSDGTTSVPIEYHGPAPDTLRDEGTAVAEGALGEDGVFHADALFAKCPSKFEAKTG